MSPAPSVTTTSPPCKARSNVERNVVDRVGLHHRGSQAGGPASQIGCPNFARSRGPFASPKDFGHDKFISILQTCGQFVQQMCGARGLMRLKDAPHPPARIHLAHGGQRGRNLGRQVRIIVDHGQTPSVGDRFQPPAQPAKGGHPPADCLPQDADMVGGGDSGQSIDDIVPSRHRQRHTPQHSPPIAHRKLVAAGDHAFDVGLPIGPGIGPHAKRFARTAGGASHAASPWAIGAGEQSALARQGRYQARKRPFQLRPRTIIVKVIGFDSQQHRHLGAQMTEVLAIFARFGNHPFALPTMAARRCVLIFSAKDKAGIGAAHPENPRQHRGSGRFAVCAGNGQSTPGGHQPAERHRIADRRHTECRRLGAAAIVGRHRIAVDHQIDRRVNAGAWRHPRAPGTRSPGGRVRTGQLPTIAAEHFGERSHPRAAGTNQVCSASGMDHPRWQLKTVPTGNTDHAAPRKKNNTPMPAG